MVARETLPEPSSDTLPVTAPVSEMVRLVCHFDAVAALPEMPMPQVPEAPPPVFVTV